MPLSDTLQEVERILPLWSRLQVELCHREVPRCLRHRDASETWEHGKHIGKHKLFTIFRGIQEQSNGEPLADELILQERNAAWISTSAEVA
jgi:hypothetical protein